MERFNATVTTTVLNKNHVEVQDTVVFSGVDQGFVDFLTGSCSVWRFFLQYRLRKYGYVKT